MPTARQQAAAASAASATAADTTGTAPNHDVYEHTVERRAGWLPLAFCRTPAFALWIAATLGARIWLFPQTGVIAFLAAPVLVLLLLSRQTIRKESVLAVKHLGIQLSSQLCLRVAGIDLPSLGRATTFLPLSTVQEVLILEGIHGWSVIYHLAVLQDDGDGVRIHVVFRSALPRLAVLTPVRKGIRQILYG